METMQIPYFIFKLRLLWNRQITQVLLRKHWDRVTIVETNEPLVEYEGFLVRKSVARKLDQVKNNLPNGLYLKILDGYRSRENQQKVWDHKWNRVALENPNWSTEQIDAEVRLVVARPIGITNHICGGAVDVCLVDKQGVMIDFGTPYGPVDKESLKRCPMFSPFITKEQKQNRTILRKAMESVGFVWYPGEWWHYCYGDRMWAVYTGKGKCFYGPIEQ